MSDDLKLAMKAGVARGMRVQTVADKPGIIRVFCAKPEHALPLDHCEVVLERYVADPFACPVCWPDGHPLRPATRIRVNELEKPK